MRGLCWKERRAGCEGRQINVMAQGTAAAVDRGLSGRSWRDGELTRTLRLGLGSRKKDSMYKSVRLETQTAGGEANIWKGQEKLGRSWGLLGPETGASDYGCGKPWGKKQKQRSE